MRNLNVGYLGAAALVALVGCSSSTKKIDRADAKQIYQQYEMSYSAADDTTKVSGQFREAGQSGDTLQLVGAATLGHDGLSLKEDTVGGTKYAADKKGFIKNHTWTFTDANGKKYVNRFAIAEAKIPDDIAARQNLDRAFKLTWVGEPVADDKDEVTLLVAPTGVEGAVSRADRITVRKAGAKDLEIPLDKVKAYGAGKRELRLERVRNVKLQAGTDAGGYGNVKYVSAPVTVEFAEPKGVPVDPKKDGDAKKDEKKDEKKPDLKKEEKKDDKAPDAKKDEKKGEKKEDKAPDAKKDEKKSDPTKDEKKPSEKKDEKKDGAKTE